MPTEIDEIERKIIQLQIEIVALKKEKDEASKERKARRGIEGIRRSGREKRNTGKRRNLIKDIGEIKEKIDHAKTEADELERKGDFGKGGGDPLRTYLGLGTGAEEEK